MRTYIIEDDSLKIGRLTEFVSLRFRHAEISLFGSFQSGLKAIKIQPPALLLLDMTLPTFDISPAAREGRLRPLGGYELMSKLKLNSIATKVIIVTGLGTFGEGNNQKSFDEIETMCREEYGDLFYGMVYYQQMNMEWGTTLERYIVAALEKE